MCPCLQVTIKTASVEPAPHVLSQCHMRPKSVWDLMRESAMEYFRLFADQTGK